MANKHDHDHHAHALPDIGAVNNRSFIIGIVLNTLFVLTEVVAGLINNSMALLTDAGHNLSDVSSLLLSLFAFRLAAKKSSSKYTYGYKKTTILAALVNAVILLVAMGVLGYESIQRLTAPQIIDGGVVAWVAGVGILVNGITTYLFFKNRKQDLNVKSAYMHMLADTLVSVGVVAGGILIAFTGWYWLDAAIGLVVMIIILVGTWPLLRDSFYMAIDAVPAGIELAEIKKVIRNIDHVDKVQHVHVWAISTTENGMTAHVVIDDALSFNDKLKVIRQIKHELQHHKIHHSTIEMESAMPAEK